jgi:hypothetical protein
VGEDDPEAAADEEAAAADATDAVDPLTAASLANANGLDDTDPRDRGALLRLFSALRDT